MTDAKTLDELERLYKIMEADPTGLQTWANWSGAVEEVFPEMVADSRKLAAFEKWKRGIEESGDKDGWARAHDLERKLAAVRAKCADWGGVFPVQLLAIHRPAGGRTIVSVLDDHDDEIIEIRQWEFDRLNKTIVHLSEKFGFLHGVLQALKFRAGDDETVKAIDAALDRVNQPAADN